MKIVVNLLNFRSENIAGVGYFMKRIFELLDARNTRGMSFHILHSPNIDVQQVFSISDELDVEYKSVKWSSSFFLRVFYEQFWLPFCLSKYDVFYSPTPAVPVLLPSINKNIKVIPTIHDLIPFFFKKKYPFLRRVYIRWITKACVRTGNIVMTVSNSTRKDIIEILGVSESKVKIVYNFIPNRMLITDCVSKKYFVTVCTIEPGKNLSNLLKGFKTYRNKYDTHGYKLFIIGKNGWNYKEIYHLCKKNGLEKDVIFTGYLSEESKDLLIRESAAMVYLSVYEGFGIPPLEAMYWNKPSIVSNVSSLPEVVGNAGIKCNPYDIEEIAEAMMSIVNDRDVFCKNIPQQLQKFDPQQQVCNFLQIITLA